MDQYTAGSLTLRKHLRLEKTMFGTLSEHRCRRKPKIWWVDNVT